MYKIKLKFLLAITAFISFSVSLSSCSGMMDYLVHIMTVPDISFAHLSGGQGSSQGRWTKEHRCEPGSYVADYGVLVSPEGTLWAIVAQCKGENAAKETNVIEMSTKRDIRTGSLTRYMAPKGAYARGFVVHNWMDSAGVRANVGERKFIFHGQWKPSCLPGVPNFTARQYMCEKGLAVCSLQVKVHGGNGIEGGSITHLRFRCCYVCQEQLTFNETLLWSSTEDDRMFRFVNGTYGVKTIVFSVGARVIGANNETGSVEFEDGATASLTSDEVDYEGDYQDKSEVETDEGTVMETPVSALTRNGSGLVTWESLAHKLFQRSDSAINHPNHDNGSNNTTNGSETGKQGKDSLARVRRAPKRRLSRRSTCSRHQAVVFESTEDDAVKDMLRSRYGKNSYRRTQVEATSKKENVKYSETFVCEPGFSCEVRQHKTRCDHRVFIDPAMMIKRKVELRTSANFQQQDNNEHWITVPDVVTVSPRLRASNTTWDKTAVCPNGSFVVDHQQSRSTLDSATVHKGIVLGCANADGRNLKWVTSHIGAEKKWKTTVANVTGIGTGYRFREKPGIRGYYYELLHTTAPDTLSGNISHGPTTVREFYCPKTSAVCGFRLSKPDSAEALRTSVEFKCCYRFIPEEKFQTTSRLQHPTLHQANHIASDHLSTENTPINDAVRSLKIPGSSRQAAGAANLEFILSYGQTGRQSDYLCPADSVAISIRTKSERGLGMTGLEMQCSRLTLRRENDSFTEQYEKSRMLAAEVSTVSGKWDKEAGETGRPVTGFYIDWNRDKPLEGFKVSYGPIFGPEEGNVMTQNEVLFCPPQHKVCGFGYTTDKANEIIARLKLKCCIPVQSTGSRQEDSPV